MARSGLRMAALCIGCAFVTANGSTSWAQEKIAIKLKLFDTNNPDSPTPLQARPSATLSIRDKATRLPAFPASVDLTPLDDGFYEVQVAKNVLIEHLVIEIVGTRYNPADITKVVTRAPMTIYPGASEAGVDFSVSAYMAQMNNYRAILTDLITALPAQRSDIQAFFGAKFRDQLESMARLPAGSRLLNATPEQRAAAIELANEVLVLYGLRSQSPTAAPSPPCLNACCPRKCVAPCQQRLLARHKCR